jgi:thiamine kinase-like enzyme
VKVEACGESNDGFLSDIVRVLVAYRMNSADECKSFVVKMASSNEIAVEKIGPGGFDVHNKEINFFEIVAPQMEKILKRLDDENVFTKVVVVDRENEVIVFEDLKVEGFEMPEKSVGIDEKQTKLALKKLAKFHAASMILQAKHPKVFDDFDVGFFSRKVGAFNFAHQSIFDAVVEEVSTWQGFEKYAEKLEKLKPNLIENATRCFDVKPGDFCVLNHGDLWKNNLMFKMKEGGEMDDAIMVDAFEYSKNFSLSSTETFQIDFQFCHWASPVLDLIHLFYTSLNFDLYKQSEIEVLVQFYYYQLRKALTDLDFDVQKIPSLHQLQLEFVDKLFYGLIVFLIAFTL